MPTSDRPSADKSDCSGAYAEDAVNNGARNGRELALNQKLFSECYSGTDHAVSIPLITPGTRAHFEAVPANDPKIDLYMQVHNSLGMTGNIHDEDQIRRGSGFFVDEEGLFGTVKHVVEPPGTELFVQTPDRVKHKATIVAQDPANDLALLKVEPSYPGEKFAPVDMGSSTDLARGDDVAIVGMALPQNPFKPSTPIISIGKYVDNIKDSDARLDQNERLDYVDTTRELVKTDARTLEGNSGGIITHRNKPTDKPQVVAVTDYGDMLGETDGVPIERMKELVQKYRASQPHQ